ncbi:hypothetical protein ABW20_dc0108499 [Dactylellina cionopaga]|nr:hypothetical protein ABW20_dc0108499 [Dactylellina cionopaga]
MPAYKGITCDMYVQDQKVAEYNVQKKDSTCRTYVESQEDELFSFKVNVNKTSLSSTARLDLELWADGQKLDSFTFTETEYLVDDAQVHDYMGLVKTVKLRFAPLVIVDEDMGDSENRKEILEKLGTLEVKIWRAHQDVIQTASLAYEPNMSQIPIYEKNIKGYSVSHCTELANPKLIANPSSWGYLTRKVDPYHTPWVTFVFRHASKALLRAGGILTSEAEKRETAQIQEDMLTEFDKLAIANTKKQLQDINATEPKENAVSESINSIDQPLAYGECPTLHKEGASEHSE